MQHNIVLIDDNFAIRQIIKIFLSRLAKKYTVDINVFSTDNGVEGLGYVYITSPQIVIVDTTLPKYSGREVLDFFIQNPKFHGQDTHVIVLHELSTTEVNLPPDFYLINKDKPQAFHKLAEILIGLLEISDHGRTREIFDRLANFIFHNSNEDDLLLRKLEGKSFLFQFLLRIKWTWLEFTSSIILTLLLIIFGKPDDNNSTQKDQDKKAFRFKYYPVLIISLFSIAIISINFSLFFVDRINIGESINNNIIFEGKYTIPSDSIIHEPAIKSVALNTIETVRSLKESSPAMTSFFDFFVKVNEEAKFVNDRLRYFLSMQFVASNTKILSTTSLNLFLLSTAVSFILILSKGDPLFLWRKDNNWDSFFMFGIASFAAGFTYGVFAITDTFTIINYAILALYLLIVVLAVVFYFMDD